MEESAARRDVHYEGCYSGVAGVKGWLGGTLGFLFGIVFGIVAAASLPDSAPLVVVAVVGVAVWIACTIFGAVFVRMRPFSVRVHPVELAIVEGRGSHSVPYDQIRFVDAGSWVETFLGGEWGNARVCLRLADGRTTRVGLNRVTAASFVEELRWRCSRAGGLDLDEESWLPAETAFQPEARGRLRRLLIERAVVDAVLGGIWLAVIAVMAVLVAANHRESTIADWKNLAAAAIAIPFAARSLRRGLRFAQRARL